MTSEEERKARNREYQKRWKLKNPKKARETNRKCCENYRNNHSEKWNDYFKGYFKKWLEKPENYFSHQCRIQLRSKKKDTKEWKKAKEEKKSFDHILPVRMLGVYFMEVKGFDLKDKKLCKHLKEICNRDVNLRVIKSSHNSRGNNANLKKILSVACILEDLFPFYCEGLVDFVNNNSDQINK